MALNVIQTASLVNQLGLSVAATFGSSVTANNSIVVAAFSQTSTSTVSSVSGGGPTYALHGQRNINADVEIWVGNLATGGSTTVTVHFTGSGNPGIGLAIAEVSGGSLTLRNTGGTSGAGTNPTAPSITTVVGDLVISGLCYDTGTGGLSQGAGWSSIGFGAGSGAEWMIATGTSTSATYTNANPGTWDSVISGFFGTPVSTGQANSLALVGYGQ